MIHPTPLAHQESNTATDEKLDATHLEAGQEHTTILDAKELAGEEDDAARALEG
jgi:hypothetical protein